ncbi:aldose epimerase family protein [Costertonia aggregata]|uniref:Aldose 1-epimerase n=1 Tax=Costertonia aggregata TaxID=343403 RepID=A0A7H9ART0_9FLAO|nr:aldose 1-epimerase [Costertonia aggregata]QLG46150.1 aldose 1-epimerase [Costertonia aggregata]
MITLHLNDQQAKIEAGELVSYQVDGHEYIHQKGSPGWRSSDTEMFPIIGPTNEADFRVQTPKGKAVQDQHGLLREMEYSVQSKSETKAIFIKRYKAKTQVKNSKYPDRSTEKLLSWPYDFSFGKIIELTLNGLQITFQVSGEKGMPFMLGYHPAFKLHTKNPTVFANGKAISLKGILAVGNRAMPVLDCNELSLKDKNGIRLKTDGFRHFMLWTEVPNMVCLEPITFYPYAVEQENIHQGFQHFGDTHEIFRVLIQTDK